MVPSPTDLALYVYLLLFNWVQLSIALNGGGSSVTRRLDLFGGCRLIPYLLSGTEGAT